MTPLKKLSRNIRTDFTALWNRLFHVAESSGDVKLKALLMNHSERREYICRKLGVITEADVNRVHERIRNN